MSQLKNEVCTWDNLKFENDVYSQTKELNNQISLKDILKNLNICLQETNQSNWSHKGCCPFPDHNDDSPSFYVNFTINKFNCFGCNKKGGPVQFISILENKSNSEVIEQLSQSNYYINKTIVKTNLNNQKSFITDDDFNNLLNYADLNYSFLKENNFSDEAFQAVYNLNHLSEFYIRSCLSSNSSLEDLEQRLDLISVNFI